MRALCISTRPCFYRHDTGYCGYVGNGCALDDTSTAKGANTPTYRITQLVDISPESIEEIANAVAEKLREAEVKHGHWIPGNTSDAFCACSRCGFPLEAHGAFKLYKYCTNCGARMDEVTG